MVDFRYRDFSEVSIIEILEGTDNIKYQELLRIEADQNAPSELRELIGIVRKRLDGNPSSIGFAISGKTPPKPTLEQLDADPSLFGNDPKKES